MLSQGCHRKASAPEKPIMTSAEHARASFRLLDVGHNVECKGRAFQGSTGLIMQCLREETTAGKRMDLGDLGKYEKTEGSGNQEGW